MIELACPECKHTFDAHTVIGEGLLTMRPQPGDMTVCLHCAEILQFEANGLRLADAVDLAELDEDVLDELALARHAIRTMRYQHTLRRE